MKFGMLIAALCGLAATSVSAQGDAAQRLSSRAREAIHAEKVRQKAGTCKGAQSTAEVNQCLVPEMEKSKANYLGLVRSLGALMRLTDAGAKEKQPRALPFDDAEAAWVSYRDRTCDLIHSSFGNGTGAGPAYGFCLVELTGNHIRELSSIYAEQIQ